MVRRMSGKITKELGILEMTPGLKRDARKNIVTILIMNTVYNAAGIREIPEPSQVDSTRRLPKNI